MISSLIVISIVTVTLKPLIYTWMGVHFFEISVTDLSAWFTYLNLYCLNNLCRNLTIRAGKEWLYLQPCLTNFRSFYYKQSTWIEHFRGLISCVRHPWRKFMLSCLKVRHSSTLLRWVDTKTSIQISGDSSAENVADPINTMPAWKPIRPFTKANSICAPSAAKVSTKTNKMCLK